MANNDCFITVGVDDSTTIPISLRNGETILECISKKPSVATCSSNGSSVTVTGHRPGTTFIAVIIGFKGRPLRQQIFAVNVIEDDDE